MKLRRGRASSRNPDGAESTFGPPGVVTGVRVGLATWRAWVIRGSWVAWLGASALVVIALVANVLSARHYKRWDVTSDKRYSLSPATIATLHELSETLHVWVLFSGGDPLRESVKQMLVAYQGESARMETHFVDPDRDPAAYGDLRRRFKMDVGRGKNGVASDAVIVVAQGDRHWFIGSSDLFEVEKADDPRAKPREERALTSAIRSVLGGKRPRLCFTVGHGERDTKDGSADGLAFLSDLLEKDNYEIASVDTSEPGALTPFKDCEAVVVAGARAPFTPAEENRLRTYLMLGGNALIGAGPLNADTDSGLLRPGLAQALEPFGIVLDEDLVFEMDQRLVFPDSRGIRFVGLPKSSELTQALVAEPGRSRPVPRTIVHFTRSMRRGGPADMPMPQDLLTTTADAYGVVNVRGAADWTGTPEKKGIDIAGPLVLAMASERPKLRASDPHGPRLVVIGSGSAFLESHWRVDSEGRGMAMLVENAIAWISAKPQVLDVPERQTLAAGVRISADARREIQYFVLGYIPLAALLLALVVYLLRRSGERAPYRPISRNHAAGNAESGARSARETKTRL
jgi:hypothetical protein